jgi:hypothetical protein
MEEESTMKIVLDLRVCNCWDAACAAHFSSHFLVDEKTPVDCVVDMIEDGDPQVTFQITDRDGAKKTLVVGQENYTEAYDSWRDAWQKQQASEG